MLDRLDDRSHLITGISCSNTSPSLFAYGTNRGSIFVCDTRSSSLCDHPSLGKCIYIHIMYVFLLVVY
ncbi:unnamed protein product [Trichobilharzia regenti]|nr:unnamed protein product [Trichobilharzia regenti]